MRCVAAMHDQEWVWLSLQHNPRAVCLAEGRLAATNPLCARQCLRLQRVNPSAQNSSHACRTPAAAVARDHAVRSHIGRCAGEPQPTGPCMPKPKQCLHICCIHCRCTHTLQHLLRISAQWHAIPVLSCKVIATAFADRLVSLSPCGREWCVLVYKKCSLCETGPEGWIAVESYVCGSGVRCQHGICNCFSAVGVAGLAVLCNDMPRPQDCWLLPACFQAAACVVQLAQL